MLDREEIGAHCENASLLALELTQGLFSDESLDIKCLLRKLQIVQLANLGGHDRDRCGLFHARF